MRYAIGSLLIVLGFAPVRADGQRSHAETSAMVSETAGAPLFHASGITARRLPLLKQDSIQLASDAAKSVDTRASVGRYMFVGLLSGAAAGTLGALLVTHQSSVTDHSEDGIVYMIFVPAGALAGLVAGGLLGAIAHRSPASH